MKITLNIPAAKLRQVIALIWFSTGKGLPDEVVEEIINTPEADITEVVNECDQSAEVTVAFATLAVGKVLQTIDPSRLEESLNSWS